jgi:hypothetical protein
MRAREVAGARGEGLSIKARKCEEIVTSSGISSLDLNHCSLVNSEQGADN